MNADLVLASRSIFNGTDTDPFDGYIAIKDGYIISIDKGKFPIEKYHGVKKFIDLGNKTITPGFTDVHCFFTGYAVHFAGADLSPATTIDEVFSIIGTDCDNKKVILGHGINEKLITSNNCKRLNELFVNVPVILFSPGCETCLMNTKANEIYNFTKETCYPESYVKLLPDILSDRDFIIPLFKRYMNMLNRMGVTCVKEMGFDDFFGFTDILKELEDTKALSLRVHFMSQPVEKPMSINYGLEMKDKFKGEFVHFSGYNQMTDGSVSELCADLKEPYLCADTTCAQKIDWDTLRKDTLKADSEGFRFSLHAQGDAAIQKVLDIYDNCKRNQNGRLINRHSITDLEFSDPKDIERMGKLGAIAEIYPQIQSIANRKDKLKMIEDKIGLNRGTFYWNRRKMIDSNVTVSCGTDLPLLIDNIPESIYHAVGGYFPEGGEAYNKENMISIKELLKAWTYGGAYNLGLDEELGSFREGYKADVVVFNGNIFDTPIEQIRDMYVEQTYLDGNRIY